MKDLNSRLDTLQATILLEKVKFTHSHNDYRRMVSSFYDKQLSTIKEVKLTSSKPGSSRHLYVIRIKNRNKLANFF